MEAKRQYTAEDNAALLASWNAWKEVCWVHGLGKPRDGAPVIGTAEDEARLERVIAQAFKRKREPYEANPMFAGAFDGVDWAQVFDTALFEYEHVDRYPADYRGVSGKMLKKKAWKDFVWKAVAESDDSPTKVIYGKLLGRPGKINDIFENWLRERFPESRFVTDDESGKKTLNIADSIDAAQARGREAGEWPCGPDEEKPKTGVGGCWYASNGNDNRVFNGEELEDPDEGAGGEAGARDAIYGGEKIKVSREWLADLEKAFPPRLCCLMVAHIHGVKTYNDKEILDALGIGHTTAAKNLQDLENQTVWEGIDPECRDWLLNDVAGTRFFKNWITKRCQAEKAGLLILSRVETNAATAAE